MGIADLIPRILDPESSISSRIFETPDEGDPRAESGSARTHALSLDTVFHLLANERRRRVLRHLIFESESVTLSELAEKLAALENDKPVSALESTERKRVYISLYQAHLPKLDDAGVVDFDRNRGTIIAKDPISQLEPHLRIADKRGDLPEAIPR